MLPAAWLDNLVWEDCRRWIRNPGDTIADAQRELRARMEQTTGLQSQRRALQQQLGEKDTERERILTLYRRNRITVAEAEGQLDAIARETADLRQMLEGIGSQTALAAAYEAHLTEAASLLLRLQGRLEEVDQMNDWATKREIVEHLVAHIGVRTDAGPTRKRASLVIRYSFGEPHAVVTGSA